MKRILSLLLAVAPAFSSAQNFPFPTSNAQWITARKSGCFGGSNIYNLWREYLGPDTVLQNKTYQLLYLEPECTLTTEGMNCSHSLDPYQGSPIAVGGLRQEGSRVFFYKFNVSDPAFNTYERPLTILPSEEDILLYDFNGQAGDTLLLPSVGAETFHYTITNVTTLPSGRKQLTIKRLYTIGYTHQIVEGAGNTMGLFSNYSNPAASSYLPLPSCFFHNGIQVLTSTECEHCGNVSAAAEPAAPVFKIYPNPAADWINFEVLGAESLPRHFDLRVYSPLGQLLYRDANFLVAKGLAISPWRNHAWLAVALRDKSNGRIWVERVELGR